MAKKTQKRAVLFAGEASATVPEAPGPEGALRQATVCDAPHGFSPFFKSHCSASPAWFSFTLSRSPFPRWLYVTVTVSFMSEAALRCYFRGRGDAVSAPPGTGNHGFLARRDRSLLLV